MLAMHLRGDAFSAEEKARNFAYYERLTVRDSSLSACTQAVIAAEVGHLELAYDYFAEAALIDLDDLEHNTRDGVHIASLAGAWIAAVAGFGGMRDHDGDAELRAAPARTRSPGWRSASASVGDDCWSRSSTERATYSLLDGPPLEIAHFGRQMRVTRARPIALQIPRAQPTRASDSTAGTGPSPSQSLTSADRRSRPTGSPARTNQTPLARDHTARRLRRQAIHRRRHGGSRLSRQASPAGARLRSPNFDHHAGRGVAHGHADAGLRLASV